MDKIYNHKNIEERIYKEWEEKGYFTPKMDAKKKPFSIILPPPNANAPLHFGHAMYVIEDILIRYHRMMGEPTLWLPGADHAGFETQFVFEKKLQKEGKSRLDYKREELYQMIWDYVAENRGKMEQQLRRLGFSLDWTRKKFTLDPDIIKIVYRTFKKLFDDGLLYRGERLVNYCTRCGTSFSDLEVNHREQKDPLYFLKYGPFVLATVRPETKFGDTAVAVNPQDKRYKSWVGREIEVEGAIGRFKVKVIEDDLIDPAFGTGVAKVTPAHDMKDFEIGKRHNLKTVQVIGFDGKLNEKAGKYRGMYIKQARKAIAEDMQKMGLIEKVDENYTHTIEVCYKCGTTIEPMLLPQWFVKMEPLAKKAIEVIEKNEIKFYPTRHKKVILDFLKNIRDWNISRQTVWGIRIPAWFRNWKPEKNVKIMGFHERTAPQVLSGKVKTYRLEDRDFKEFKEGERFAFKNSQTGEIFGYGTILKSEQKMLKEIPLDDKSHGSTYEKREELIEALKFHKPELEVNENIKVWIYTYSFGLLKNGTVEEIYIGEEKPIGEGWHKDPDTFDTWFSSAQWPFATLRASPYKSDFDYFYPTSVMETMYDILLFWVARMIMMGIYVTGKTPFKDVVLHGMVKDPLGKKMSKSKGNVADPLETVEKYGADAVRFALVYGTAFGNDQALSYPKLEAARKFINKLWNIARFIEFARLSKEVKNQTVESKTLSDSETKYNESYSKKIQGLVKEITGYLNNYQFNYAAEKLYEFTWHDFADFYIEEMKKRIRAGASPVKLVGNFLIILKLLHPFIPFVTEEIYRRFDFGESIMVDTWPAA